VIDDRQGKVKVKVEVYRSSIIFILNLYMSSQLHALATLSTEQESRWDPELVWMYLKTETPLAHARN